MGKKEEDEECGYEKYREKAGKCIQNSFNEVLKEIIKVLFKILSASFKIVWTFMCLFIEDGVLDIFTFLKQILIKKIPSNINTSISISPNGQYVKDQ